MTSGPFEEDPCYRACAKVMSGVWWVVGVVAYVGAYAFIRPSLWGSQSPIFSILAPQRGAPYVFMAIVTLMCLVAMVPVIVLERVAKRRGWNLSIVFEGLTVTSLPPGFMKRTVWSIAIALGLVVLMELLSLILVLGAASSAVQLW